MSVNLKEIMVVGGGMIYEFMDAVQKQWIGMIEDVLASQGFFPEFEEFSKLADELKISRATPEELKTVWWDKYQEMVREIGSVLSGNKQ